MCRASFFSLFFFSFIKKWAGEPLLDQSSLMEFLWNGTLDTYFMVLLCFTKMHLIVVMLTQFTGSCRSSSVGSWLPRDSLLSFPQNQAMVDDIIHQPLCQFSQWLHWSLFGSGWLVITFVNTFSCVCQCVQLQFLFVCLFFSYGCLERLRFCAKWNTQNFMHIYKNHTMLSYETYTFHEA